jgi:hypothetical protein
VSLGATTSGEIAQLANEAEIAGVVGIDGKALRKHYRSELDHGHTKANARVDENLYRKATGDGREAVIAAIFWLKTRAGRKETSVTELAGKQHKPVNVLMRTFYDPPPREIELVPPTMIEGRAIREQSKAGRIPSPLGRGRWLATETLRPKSRRPRRSPSSCPQDHHRRLQKRYLLQIGILDAYYALANLPVTDYEKPSKRCT